MIYVNKYNRKERKSQENGSSFEQPKRIFYKIDSKYREVYTVFESKMLYNLDIQKRLMVKQEKKSRLLVSELSNLNARLTGRDQYDNPVKLAEPQELTALYSDIKIKELKIKVALAEGVVRTRQYKEQFIDILYKRVVLRGLNSLNILKDIALLYDKKGFENHKVIRVEPLTTGSGVTNLTKRLDERIDLVIKHDIDTQETFNPKKILNYGGIWYRVIDTGFNKNISKDGLSGIDNEDYLIENFKRRLNKDAYENDLFAGNYNIKILTPAQAYYEIHLWVMYGLRLVQDELNIIKEQDNYIIDKGKEVKDAVKELEDLGKLDPIEPEGKIIKEDQGVNDIEDILEKEEKEAIDKGEKEPTPPYEDLKDRTEIIEQKENIIKDKEDKISNDKDKIETKPDEIDDSTDDFTDFPIHDKDNSFNESFTAGITHRFKTTDLFSLRANPERIINTFIPSKDAANPIPEKQGLFNLSTLNNDSDKTYENLLFETGTNNKYIVVGTAGKLKVVELQVNLTTALDNSEYIINVSESKTQEVNNLFSTNNSVLPIVFTTGLHTGYTVIENGVERPLTEEEYKNFNYKTTDITPLLDLSVNHPTLVTSQTSKVVSIDGLFSLRGGYLEDANKIRFNHDYYDIFKPVSKISAQNNVSGNILSTFNHKQVSKFNEEYLNNGQEAHNVNVIQLTNYFSDNVLSFNPKHVSKLDEDSLNNGQEAHVVNVIQLTNYFSDNAMSFNPKHVSKLDEEYLNNGQEAHNVNVIQLTNYFSDNTISFNISNSLNFGLELEDINENVYNLVNNIEFSGLESIKGLMYSVTNEKINLDEVNIPISVAKSKLETILNDINLRNIDKALLQTYLNDLYQNESNYEYSSGLKYNDSWIYFNIDSRDSIGESLSSTEQKIAISIPTEVNLFDTTKDINKDINNFELAFGGALNYGSIIGKDQTFHRISTVKHISTIDVNIPTDGHEYNLDIPDTINSVGVQNPYISTMFRLNPVENNSYQMSKYNEFDSAKLPNSYIRFDNGINKANDQVSIVTLQDTNDNEVQMDLNKAEIPVISTLINPGVSVK